MVSRYGPQYVMGLQWGGEGVCWCEQLFKVFLPLKEIVVLTKMEFLLGHSILLELYS